MDVLKVSAKSNPNSVAGALAGVLREHGRAEMQAIGAGALNQAIKAVAIARGFVAPSGMDLICIPAFIEIEIEEDESLSKKFLTNFRFSDAYLSTNLQENQTLVIKNGLKSCSYKEYLASTNPLNIQFCVYRI